MATQGLYRLSKFQQIDRCLFMISKVNGLTDILLNKFVFNSVVELPFREVVVQKIKTFVRRRIFIRLWVQYVSNKLIPLDEKSKRDNCIRMLVLNHHRFGPDLNVLKGHPEVHLIALPFQYQAFLNSFSVNRTAKEGSNGNFEECGFDTKASSYLYHFLPAFVKKNKIDCIISCAFYYIPDLGWQDASRRTNVPFFVLQKEITVDEGNRGLIVKRWREYPVFRGKKILVNTRNGKDVFIEAGVCESRDIVVTGHLKIDSLYKRAKGINKSQTKKQIVLFSFLPAMVAGLNTMLQLEGSYERYNRYQGFSKLFEQVHGALAEIADKNPNIIVVIKCKWLGKWEELVNEVILAESSLHVSKIPNLIVTNGPAQKYIEESMVVISFSSTSTIESRLYGRSVIVPFFAEAAGKYKCYVYFRKYFEEFVLATSKEDLKAKVLQHIENEIPPPPLSDEMIKEYVTYFDGKTVDRVVKEIKKAL